MTVFEIQGLDHVVLRVRDQALMIKFYCDVLGCLVERRSDNGALHQLRAGTSLIDLVTTTDAKEIKSAVKSNATYHNMDHFCVRIDPFNPRELLAHLRDHGIKPGPVENRYGAEGYGPSIYVNDPEGYRIELRGPPSSG